MTDTKKLAARSKQVTAQRRRRAILWRRFCVNIGRRPWLLVCFLLLLTVLGWAMARVSIPLPGGNQFPALVLLWNHAVKASAWLIAFLLAATVLISAPPRAKAAEAALAHIKFTDRYGYPPALISKGRSKSAKTESLIFYSAGISLGSWVERQGDIQDALDAVYVELPQYAYNKRYYVMLTVAPGMAKPREKPLYDDEL